MRSFRSMQGRRAIAAALMTLLFDSTATLADPADTKLSDLPNSDRAIAAPATRRAEIAAIIDREAKRAGIPAAIAEAVVHTESGYVESVIGGDGEIGLMQVLPSTARMMGFSGSLTELAVPETNIRYGVSYLAQAWRLAGSDICTAVMKYRAGHGESRFSHLSVDYCVKVRTRLSARGYAVTGTVPVATFGRLAGKGKGGGGGCGGKCIGGTSGSADLEAFNSKINQIIVKITVKEISRP
jgi:soluble lytic murein transglycosylase-like protein